MIGFLTGIIQAKFPDAVILLVGGVGYRVLVCQSTWKKILVRKPCQLYIHTHVRDDAIGLYGFEKSEELTLFNLLLSVSGVGPKTALLVIDTGVNKIEDAIAKADVDFFCLIPRLGRKNAQKIIIELKNKLADFGRLVGDGQGETGGAMDALQAMGYTRFQAAQALKDIPQSAERIEEKIRWALKNIGKKK